MSANSASPVFANMAIIDPPGAVNFSKQQPDESESYSSAPEYEPYLSDSSVSASEQTVQPRAQYIDSESESDMNDGDKQPTEKDVFGSSSEDEDANGPLRQGRKRQRA